MKKHPIFKPIYFFWQTIAFLGIYLIMLLYAPVYKGFSE